eukprot:173974-Chlamydomonas_euryale.AAC.1
MPSRVMHAVTCDARDLGGGDNVKHGVAWNLQRAVHEAFHSEICRVAHACMPASWPRAEP